jgi:calcium binding protein 39
MVLSSNSGPSTPFEWLSGGLFFGKKTVKPNQINSSKDIVALLHGVQQCLLSLQQNSTLENTDDQGTTMTHDIANDHNLEESLSARLRRLRFLLYDERRHTSQSETPDCSQPAVASKVIETLISINGVVTENGVTDLTQLLMANLYMLPFEARKDFSAIFSYLLVCGLEGVDAESYRTCMTDFCTYVERNFESITSCLVKNHDSSTSMIDLDVVLHSGMMFRSCIKHLSLFQKLVSTRETVEEFVFPFLDKFVHSPNFDCASDAMESLKMILSGGSETLAEIDVDPNVNSRSQQLAEFLERYYEEIWERRFNTKLLSSEESSYLIRRVALQILTAVLLKRTNYNIMVRYINDKNNLILIMLLLRDKSPHITLDAFHVFKIFVINPNKPPEIIKILSTNKAKLRTYLDGLHKEKELKETQFRDEKALVISTIDAL